MPQKVVVIYSGGMDSFTVLHKAINDGHEVYALSFNYGQRHVRELECAKAVCAELGINHKVVDISAINQLIGGSSLTSDTHTLLGRYGIPAGASEHPQQRAHAPPQAPHTLHR